MEYNSKDFIDLLKKDQYLTDKGSSLEKEDRPKYLQLLNYSVKLSDYVHWLSKKKYFTILRKFINLEISTKEFVDQFREIHNTEEKIVKELKTNFQELGSFQLNPRSFGFTKWTSEISLACDEFYNDFQLEDLETFSFARDEKNLRAFIADIIPEIEKYS